MVRRKNHNNDSGSDSSSSESGSDMDAEFLSLSKKQKATAAKSGSGSDSDWDGKMGRPKTGGGRAQLNRSHSSSGSGSESGSGSGSSSNSGSDSSDDEGQNIARHRDAQPMDDSPPPAVAAAPKQTSIMSPLHRAKAAAAANGDDDDDIEDGEVNTSDGDTSESSSCESEFNDGFDDDLMGDSEDRARLESLTEKEREQEIFKRIEERDRKRTHWEIKRKLRLKAERARDTGITPAEKLQNDERKARRRRARKAREERQAADRQREQAAAKAAVAAAAAVAASVAASAAKSKVADDTVGSLVDAAAAASASGVQAASSCSQQSASQDSHQAVSEEENWDDEPDFSDAKVRSKDRKQRVEANRTDDKRSNAMAMLKAKREGKLKRDEEEAKRQAEQAEGDRDEIVGGSKSSTKLKASDVYSDDSGSESEAEGVKRKRSTESSRSDSDSDRDGSVAKSAKAKTVTIPPPVKRTNLFITSKEELNKIRLSRYKVERFVALPHFASVVTGCFVRISIGDRNSQPVYRVAEVAGVIETSKIYVLGKFRTNKGLRLKFSTAERVFRLEFLSNQDFSDSEFNKWKQVCSENGVQVPSLDLVDRKSAEIKAAMEYEFKDEDVHRIIEEKNRFRKYPTNYAMKKTTLMKERDAALLRGEDQVAADINLQIEELDDRANELDKRRSSTISSISYINDRNRKRNVQEAEKAIMEEVRASRGVRADDPFTRRCTKPTMTFKTKPDAKDDAAAAGSGAAVALANEAKNDKKGGDDKAKKPMAPEMSLYSLHDFEINLDLIGPLSQPALPVVGNSMAAPKNVVNIPRRSLNLEAFKKQRGLI